jgi:hypothetical protein
MDTPSMGAADARTDFDRRQRNVGPPNGVERRRGDRRATDALKMSCPFCGSSESGVVRSWGAIQDDKVRRRRQCANPSCVDAAGRPRRYPTSERVDWNDPELQRELRDAGIDPEAAIMRLRHTGPQHHTA